MAAGPAAIKPDNVLLAGVDATDWGRCVPKLADFGLARPPEVSQQLTQDAAALGTPAFMAPEQTGLASDLGGVGIAADIHGLGGLAFALLTGRPPFAADTATASLQRAAEGEIFWPRLRCPPPRDLRAIVEKCLERSPARRYASATDLGEDLHRFLEGLPVLAQPVSPLRRVGRAIRRRPVVAAVVGLSTVFILAAIGGGAYHATTIAGARLRIDRSERFSGEAAGVAARSMSRLTGALVEQMIQRSPPDDMSHLDFLRQIREEFFRWPLGRVDEARDAVEQAERVAAHLLDRQPGIWDHAALQARVFQQQAELAAARGDAAVAADWFQRVIDLMVPHLAKPACRDRTEALIASARAGLVTVAHDAGDPSAAVPAR